MFFKTPFFCSAACLVFQKRAFLLPILSSSAIFHSFAKRRFFCNHSPSAPQFFRVFKNYPFSCRASQLFAVFKNDHPRSCRFPKRAFSAVSAASIIVFQYFTFSPVRQLSPVSRDPFCFPKFAFIAPVLPIMNSFQIPFFSACSAVFLLVFEIYDYLPRAMIVFKYHDFLFSRLSFLKSILFCIAPFSFSKTMNYCAWFWKMPFSCFDFGKSPIIAPRSSGRFNFGKLEISASLAAGKTDFRIFGKLKRITRRASAKNRDIGKLSFWFASLEDLQAPIIINILI